MRTAEITAPFTILVDSREQQPYTFEAIHASVSGRPKAKESKGPSRPRIIVPTQRAALAVGDYSIFGLPQIAIERKSKADLYGSVARRANFVGRLERMSELTFGLVVVEADYLDLLRSPPRHSSLNPRSLSGTLVAWSIRYPVRWAFISGRDAAERLTYRYLERFYLDHRESMGAREVVQVSGQVPDHTSTAIQDQPHEV